jgi:hypothetical protein
MLFQQSIYLYGAEQDATTDYTYRAQSHVTGEVVSSCFFRVTKPVQPARPNKTQ